MGEENMIVTPLAFSDIAHIVTVKTECAQRRALTGGVFCINHCYQLTKQDVHVAVFTFPLKVELRRIIVPRNIS